MKEQIVNAGQFKEDPFGLRSIDFRTRIPEISEKFSSEEAEAYIDGCDFPGTADYFLVAKRMGEVVGNFRGKRILEAMCGPGVLGREIWAQGGQNIAFHDGDQTMLEHALQKAASISHLIPPCILSEVDDMPVPDNQFDLVVCHNSTHQLADQEKLKKALAEMIRVTAPGGSVLIFDFQRRNDEEFVTALEERLTVTKPEIVPLLIPTFLAAFSKEQFQEVLETIPGISWQIKDAQMPQLELHEQEWVNRDPVKGHVLDRSPISLEVIIQKEQV